MFVCFSASVTGESHKKSSPIKPCEDYSGAFEGTVIHNGKETKYALAIVADGHGGDKYLRSRFGSQFAVETAREVIEKFLTQTADKSIRFFDSDAQTDTDKKADHTKTLAELETRIINTWRQKVAEHIQANPLNEKEEAFCKEKGITLAGNTPSVVQYGTTLIAVLVTDFFWFALHIGDGAAVIVHEDGSAEFAVKDDDDQGFGTTYSLCNDDAAAHFRHNFGFETLLGATAASDGVTDSYSRDKYLEITVKDFLNNLVKDPSSEKELREEYLPMLSKKGSQDDVSLSCVFNNEAAKPVLSSAVENAQAKYRAQVMEKELVRAKAELDVTRNERDDLQKKVGTLNERYTQAKTDLDAARKDREALQKEVDTLNGRYTQESNIRIQTEKNLKTVQADLSKVQYELNELKGPEMKKLKTERDEAQEAAKGNLKSAKYYENLYKQEIKAREKVERDLEKANTRIQGLKDTQKMGEFVSQSANSVPIPSQSTHGNPEHAASKEKKIEHAAEAIDAYKSKEQNSAPAANGAGNPSTGTKVNTTA